MTKAGTLIGASFARSLMVENSSFPITMMDSRSFLKAADIFPIWYQPFSVPVTIAGFCAIRVKPNSTSINVAILLIIIYFIVTLKEKKQCPCNYRKQVAINAKVT